MKNNLYEQPPSDPWATLNTPELIHGLAKAPLLTSTDIGVPWVLQSMSNWVNCQFLEQSQSAELCTSPFRATNKARCWTPCFGLIFFQLELMCLTIRSISITPSSESQFMILRITPSSQQHFHNAILFRILNLARDSDGASKNNSQPKPYLRCPSSRLSLTFDLYFANL